jgi:hypothetical protein
MTDSEENQTGAIPEFFYDIIARMIPGLLAIVIYMYWSKADFKSVVSNVGMSGFVLVAAWVVGVTLDVGVFAIAKKICSGKWLQKVAPDLNPLLGITRKLPPFERRLIAKALAQIIFFRNMMVICGSAALICLVMCFLPIFDLLLPALRDHDYLCGLLCVILWWVFWLCWKLQRGSVADWLKAEVGAGTPGRTVCLAPGPGHLGSHL